MEAIIDLITYYYNENIWRLGLSDKYREVIQRTKNNFNESVKEVFSLPVLVNNIRFMSFLSFLAILYITNAHFADRAMIGMNNIQKELKELRWEYMNTKSELMYKSKQTEIKKLVTPLGLEELKQPPKKIIIAQE